MRRFARWANFVMFFVNIVLAGGLVAVFGLHGAADTSRSLDYKDLVAIILTALGVILAAVTVFIAIGALWGYATIKDEAAKRATEVATKVAESVALRESQKAFQVLLALAGGFGTNHEGGDELISELKAGQSGPKDGAG